jgi:hypothetical protein
LGSRSAYGDEEVSIYAYAYQNITLTKSTFKNDIYSYNGGDNSYYDVYLECDYDTSVITVTDCSWSNTENSYSNPYYLDEGALYVDWAGYVTLERLQFVNIPYYGT